MRNVFPIALLVIALSTPSVLMSQTSQGRRTGPVSFIDSRDTSSHVYREIEAIVRNVESRRFTDPRAPRFMLVDQKQRFGLGIGGFVRAIGSYGFDRVIPGTDKSKFRPSQIPVEGRGSTNGDGQMLFAANTSQIFLKLVGNTGALGEFSVYTSMDFVNANNAPRLREAYASFRGFTFGRTYSTFTDNAAAPPTVDVASPAGEGSTNFNEQIRYTYTVKNHWQESRWQFGAALEMPSVNATYNDYTKSITQRVPDLLAFMQLMWNDTRSHIRLTGLLRNMDYRNLVVGQNHTVTGWALQGSAAWSLLDNRAVLYGQYNYGDGIGYYINDLGSVDLDLVPNSNSAGRMLSLKSSGWFAGMQFHFIPEKLFASATYSHVHVFSKDDYVNTSTYRLGEYIAGNIFLYITQDCLLGLEYLYGNRQNRNRESAGANRASLMVRYNF